MYVTWAPGPCPIVGLWLFISCELPKHFCAKMFRSAELSRPFKQTFAKLERILNIRALLWALSERASGHRYMKWRRFEWPRKDREYHLVVRGPDSASHRIPGYLV